MAKKILVLTGGGDCPGLNAVIRGITRRAIREKNWEVYGSMEAFNGVFADPPQLIRLSRSRTAGIHVKGGTILKTTNKSNPLKFPVPQPDGSVKFEDRTDLLVSRIRELGFDAVINIGGDGSQRISQALFIKGVPVVGVPKTIDNDLSATDMTFGFQTAVQIATDSFDRLVTTAESHNRVMIMEVMGRDAGWIALHSAVAGGAEVCLIPEIPYDVQKIVKRINRRYKNGKGFVNIVVAEGAHPRKGSITASAGSKESEHVRLGGVAFQLSAQLKAAGCEAEIRETVLGHTQRGGSPVAFDRVLATMFGVHAVELVLSGSYGRMVSLRNNSISSVEISEAVKSYHTVAPDHTMVRLAKGMGISFGD